MSGKHVVLAVAVCAGLMTVWGSAAWAADPGSWRLSAGYQYTSGDYGGTQTITETYVPVTISYRYQRVAFRVTVPYVSVSGPATIIDDTTGEFAPGPGGTHGGLGDVMVSGTLYDLTNSAAAGFYLDLSAIVKFGTAKASEGLGTGENDYAVQLEALKELGRFGVFGSGGYVVRGNPGRIDLRDVPFGQVGADVLLTDGVRGGVSFAYRTSAIVNYESVREASVFVAFAGPAGLIVQPAVFKGFGSSSPSWGAGVLFSWGSTHRASLPQNPGEPYDR